MQGHVQLDIYDVSDMHLKDIWVWETQPIKKYKKSISTAFIFQILSCLSGHKIWRAIAQCKQALFLDILLYSTMLCLKSHPFCAALFSVPPDQEWLVGPAHKWEVE